MNFFNSLKLCVEVSAAYKNGTVKLCLIPSLFAIQYVFECFKFFIPFRFCFS